MDIIQLHLKYYISVHSSFAIDWPANAPSEDFSTPNIRLLFLGFRLLGCFVVCGICSLIVYYPFIFLL